MSQTCKKLSDKFSAEMEFYRIDPWHHRPHVRQEDDGRLGARRLAARLLAAETGCRELKAEYVSTSTSSKFKTFDKCGQPQKNVLPSFT
jgi:hypothetical protein